MARVLDETHDPEKRSWVESANGHEDFPLQNLPFCVFKRRADSDAAIGVGIGDVILDLGAAIRLGVIPVHTALFEAASQQTLNMLMGLDKRMLAQLRATLFRLLQTDCPVVTRERLAGLLVSAAECELLLPVAIGDYTDFLTSAWHTERHGRFKGLQEPLPKAFFSLPVAYHGRASSICVSGAKVRRPHGQFKSQNGPIRFGPSEAMDFELELAAYVGQGNPQGEPVAVGQASDHLFGFTLLNDWSAKDIQWWEQVLGPFLGKSFITTVSPWVVTAEALAPFRSPIEGRPPAAGPLLPHLAGVEDTLDINMEAWLRTARMRSANDPGVRLASTSPRHLSWNFEQMLAHHTSNGCNLRTGDLLGSGTVSGEAASAMGCMTEMTAAGTTAIELPNGELRRWLEDGDEVVFRAKAVRNGFVSIGFGECRGEIVAARHAPEEAR